jgi:signal transduction histidine kinase
MRRLYQKIYLAIIASLVMVVLVAGTLWRFGLEGTPAGHAFEIGGRLAAAALPPPDAPRETQQDAIEQLARRLGTDLALYDSAREPIASTGALPRPSRGHGAGGWTRGPGPPAWNFRLPDERWLVVRPPMRHRGHPAIGLVLFLGAIALAVALSAYPIVRGLTGRLERLQSAVEKLGAGNLAARVRVEGKDEIARLAASFNRAAARIEDLVGAHRMLLANASHELRTPLSRLRMGLELYERDRNPKHKTALQQDIAELDQLVEEILLASRLDATAAPTDIEDIDLLALAAEECAHYDECHLEGEPVLVQGEARLLRRLVRNLLENAKRHGQPPIGVVVRREGGQILLKVIDSGDGIPEAERERVFTPFHRLGTGQGGSGLGLPLVRRIARLHGGDAEVADSAEARSAICVRLPAK